MKRWRLLGMGAMMVLLLVLAAGTTVLGETAKHYGDYLPAHNWRIEIDGVTAGGFTEVSGLESEVEIIEYRNGDDPLTHKRPGKAKYKNITLKFDAGDPAARAVLAWYKQVAAGKDLRKSISLIFLDRAGQEVARYNLSGAWPVKWEGPEFDALADTHLVEEIEFVVEKVERQ